MTEDRYWIEEMKCKTPHFVDKTDVEDHQPLYILHDIYAFEDYPVLITHNASLAINMCDRFNEYEELLESQDQILKENGLELDLNRDFTAK